MDYALRYLLLVLTVITMSWSSTAQNLIAVQNGTGVTYYPHDSLQQAIDEATEGSVIHLPGGTFTRSGGFTLNNSVSLIGVGYGSDSTLATGHSVVESAFYLTDGSSDSYLAGLRFSSSVRVTPGTNPTIRNLFFHRCYFSLPTYMSSDNVVHYSNNIQFLECVISSNLSLGGSTNCKIISCILTGNVYDGSSLTVENSFVQGASLSPSQSQVCRNCNFRGNIISSNPAYYGSSSSPNFLVNNVIAGSIASINSSVLISYGNIENADLSQVFVAYATPYDATDDLHLAPGSPAIGAGPGGTDCGIYGGSSPWKDGGLPANPHVMQKAIGATTNAQGELPVTIRVAAQGN